MPLNLSATHPQLLFALEILQLLHQPPRTLLYALVERIQSPLHRKNSLHYHIINFKILYS